MQLEITSPRIGYVPYFTTGTSLASLLPSNALNSPKALLAVFSGESVFLDSCKNSCEMKRAPVVFIHFGSHFVADSHFAHELATAISVFLDTYADSLKDTMVAIESVHRIDLSPA